MYAVRNLRAPIKRKLSSKFSPRFFSSQSIGIESESSFHVIADRKLEEIMESISVVEDAESCSDINFSVNTKLFMVFYNFLISKEF